MRECLQKEGITLPKRTPGQKRPPGGAGGFLGGGGAGGAAGPQLPKGVTRAQYEAALKKCGGSTFGHGGAARFDSPAFKAALAKFATCMRQNGVNVPAPNTSGSGPVFDTKGIDTSSAQFKAAEAKCQSDLSGAFKRGAGAGGSRHQWRARRSGASQQRRSPGRRGRPAAGRVSGRLNSRPRHALTAAGGWRGGLLEPRPRLLGAAWGSRIAAEVGLAASFGAGIAPTRVEQFVPLRQAQAGAARHQRRRQRPCRGGARRLGRRLRG